MTETETAVKEKWWRDDFNEHYSHLIPKHMHEPLLNYVLYGAPVGDFLTAVLQNEFVEAFARAGGENLAMMHGWAKVMYGFVPSPALKAGMLEWQKQGGMMKNKQGHSE